MEVKCVCFCGMRLLSKNIYELVGIVFKWRKVIILSDGGGMFKLF